MEQYQCITPFITADQSKRYYRGELVYESEYNALRVFERKYFKPYVTEEQMRQSTMIEEDIFNSPNTPQFSSRDYEEDDKEPYQIPSHNYGGGSFGGAGAGGNVDSDRSIPDSNDDRPTYDSNDYDSGSSNDSGSDSGSDSSSSSND